MYISVVPSLNKSAYKVVTLVKRVNNECHITKKKTAVTLATYIFTRETQGNSGEFCSFCHRI
jgi:hypothetical protein